MPKSRPRTGGVLMHARVRKVKREDTYDEAVIERYLRKRVQEYGGKCKKAKTGENGWPDRMVLWPWGVCDFVETKRPKGGRFEPLQLETHAMLRKMNFVCVVLNTKGQVDRYVEERVGEGENDNLVETEVEMPARGGACPSDLKGAKR